jgi:hypothetical protein
MFDNTVIIITLQEKRSFTFVIIYSDHRLSFINDQEYMIPYDLFEGPQVLSITETGTE